MEPVSYTHLTDVENGAPFGADENGSQGAARLKDEGSLAAVSYTHLDVYKRQA